MTNLNIKDLLPIIGTICLFIGTLFVFVVWKIVKYKIKERRNKARMAEQIEESVYDVTSENSTNGEKS